MIENNIETLDELRKIKTVAANCKLCVPYIERMIETGETSFEILLQ